MLSPLLSQAPRFRLHMLGLAFPELLDTKLVILTDDIKAAPQAMALLNSIMGHWLEAEEYNRYCGIVDLDGYSWSERFSYQLSHYPTPVCRMATKYAPFWDSLFAPGFTYHQFSEEHMAALIPLAGKIIAECMHGGASSVSQEIVRRKRRIAHAFLDHAGMAEATAYLLSTYHKHMNWKVDPSLDGFTEITTCCKAPLPPAVLQAMSEKLRQRVICIYFVLTIRCSVGSLLACRAHGSA